MKYREKPRFIRRRRRQWKSARKLSIRDIAVLDFLWTWKTANTQLLKEVAFKEKSQWWIYKALRQLKKEKLIQTLPRGKYIETELWALTDLGFEVVLMDRDDLAQYRFKPHAPAHDYLATCLQLGGQGFYQSHDRQYFTEQMLSSLNAVNFPRAFRRIDSHIPDGITMYRSGVKEAVVGYEVDLNLKEESRYCNTLDYYTLGVNAHLVIWLVRNAWIAEKITNSLLENRTREAELMLSKTAFVSLDDFKVRVWDAECFLGKLKGASIRKIHANLLQSIGKSPEKCVQNDVRSLFFPKYKSPQKLMGCANSSERLIFKHPSGPGGIALSKIPIEKDPSDPTSLDHKCLTITENPHSTGGVS